jgi:hypothetical protein
MNHDDWAAGQDETTVTVDGHELSVAYRDEGGSESGGAEACHWVVEDRTHRYIEKLRAFLAGE